MEEIDHHWKGAAFPFVLIDRIVGMIGRYTRTDHLNIQRCKDQLALQQSVQAAINCSRKVIVCRKKLQEAR